MPEQPNSDAHWTDKLPFGRFLRAKADALKLPPAILLAAIGVVGLTIGVTGFCCLPVGVILLATSTNSGSEHSTAPGRKTNSPRSPSAAKSTAASRESAELKFNPQRHTRTDLKQMLTDGSHAQGYIGGNHFNVFWDATKHDALIGKPDSTSSLGGSKQLWGFRCADGTIIFQVSVAGDQYYYETIETESKR
jgi:hypothetical protein